MHKFVKPSQPPLHKPKLGEVVATGKGITVAASPGHVGADSVWPTQALSRWGRPSPLPRRNSRARKRWKPILG